MNTAPERPPIVTVGPLRRDGKHPVRYCYCGGPNAFGGYYPPKVFNKLQTADQIRERIKPWYDVVDNSQGTFEMPEVQK